MYFFAITSILSAKLSMLDDKSKELALLIGPETSILGSILVYLKDPLLLTHDDKEFRSKLEKLLTALANDYIK